MVLNRTLRIDVSLQYLELAVSQNLMNNTQDEVIVDLRAACWTLDGCLSCRQPPNHNFGRGRHNSGTNIRTK
jgi:hypothetical protein